MRLFARGGTSGRFVKLAAAAGMLGLLAPILGSTPQDASDHDGTAAAAVAAAATPAMAVPNATGAIPNPEEYFGFRLGSEGKLARYPRILDYLRLTSEESPRVRFETVDTTTMGNDYDLLTISSPRNLKRIDRYLRINRRLANAEGLDDAEARKLASRSKPFLLVQSSIHSTEVGNTQALPEIIHRMATENSAWVKKILDEMVILVVPSQNPDGQHLVLDYFAETAGTDYERVYPDLYHKYTGHDDNRDWFIFSQKESRTYVDLINDYRPTVVHIMHQMGSEGARIFTPPYKDPFDPSIHPLVVQNTSALGMQMARGLTAENRTGATWSSTYDWWLPSVFYEPYHGIPNVLTEIASAKDLAFTYESEDGEPLGPREQRTNYVQPYQRADWTLRQIVDYAKTATYANFRGVADRGQDLLYDSYQVARDTVEGEDLPYAYVIDAEQRDRYAVRELLGILRRGDIEVRRATEEFTVDGTTYSRGSYVVPMQQPYARWADALLKVWEYPELRPCEDESCPIIQPYDVTGHTLWMLFGIDVDVAGDPFDAELRDARMPPTPELPETPEGAWLVDPRSYGVGHFLARLQEAEVPTVRSAEAFRAAGREFAPGTLIVRPTDAATDALRKASEKTGLRVYGTDQEPAVDGFELKQHTRIGLFRGIDNMPGGWLWWLFEQYGLNFENMKAGDFDNALSERYDTIVLPEGITAETITEGLDADRYPERFAWARGVGEQGLERLREFVENGGTLVTLGSGSELARDLFDLPLENVVPKDSDQMLVPGSLVQQEFDTSHPMAWGMPATWPVWFDAGNRHRDQAYELTDPGQVEVASGYPEKGELLRSGYADGEEPLHGTSDALSVQVGEGEVFLAGTQVSYRTWSRATITMLFNAIYQGPSSPTS